LKLFHIILFLLAAHTSQALSMRGIDACFDRDIKSIQLHTEGKPLAEPVIELGSGEQLLLTFDDLNSSARNFVYKITLCDADWNESDLLFSEYIAGFQQDNIQDYRQSFNTLVGYTFFTLRIPNANTELKLSGNYKIQVMNDDEPEKVLFQKGFSVVERTLPFTALCEIRRNTLSGQPNCSQQLNLKVDYQGVNVQNPRTDVKVRITQNSFYLPVAPPTPVFITPHGIDYSFYDKNLYAGGEDYRQFDISSFEYRTLRVRKIQVIDEKYQVLLDLDAIVRQHIAYQDRNGSYIVRNARYEDNSDTESDYADVFFTLLTHRPLPGKVYVFGEFTNWELSEEYLMLYSAERTCYELTLPVKQGYYNYRYVLLDDNNEADFSAIENCSDETENTYGVYVYYRGLTDRHDRLVNATWVNSQNAI
jgi:hypothetical protein